MGAFNVVKVERTCPSCNETVELRVQFKYGDTWQYEYRIGDRLRWGGNDTGKPGAKRVVVYGIDEHCPYCGLEEGDYEVWLENDVIVSVQPSTGAYDFVNTQEVYIVVEQ
ncbi:hypothetical protein [Gloeobacter morelensis]|uniref:Uncharacterized protein n=1 Tax=Gloeobacter morelensis MG652769 TaxID=2781736 RepID=A0ABY3PKQ1_9CYAN|nr:hypothetical protein [Gloeobacter morelensis]UFP94208.1 hypothetical protein ISF26_21000 [Gloeobacter morelensis MG652769]